MGREGRVGTAGHLFAEHSVQRQSVHSAVSDGRADAHHSGRTLYEIQEFASVGTNDKQPLHRLVQ